MDATTDSRRTFVAVDLPAALRAKLSSNCGRLPGARWSNPEQYHVTLRFLGDTPVASIAKLKEALASIRAKSFRLTLREYGTFPPAGDRRPPRTLYVRPDEEERLSALQAGVEACVARVTGSAEAKAFRPHVTVARFRAAPGRDELDAWLERTRKLEPLAFRVTNFRFYASELTDKGAIHSVLAEYPLE